MADPRWPPPKEQVVNPDVINGRHDNHFMSYDVNHQDQASFQVWSMYLELEQRYSQNLFNVSN